MEINITNVCVFLCLCVFRQFWPDVSAFDVKLDDKRHIRSGTLTRSRFMSPLRDSATCDCR